MTKSTGKAVITPKSKEVQNKKGKTPEPPVNVVTVTEILFNVENGVVAQDRLCLHNEIPQVVEASPFNPTTDAQTLKDAMKGWKTDEDALIQALCTRSYNQRQQIDREYRRLAGKDLEKDVKSATSGNFQKVLSGLLSPHFDYIAKTLHKSMSGVGTNEGLLIDILCTASKEELKSIQESYQRLYLKSFVPDIVADCSYNFKKVLVALVTEERCSDTIVSVTDVIADVTVLQKAGVQKLGTDEAQFIKILTTRSYAYLRELFKQHKIITKKDFEDSITSEFSGSIQDALLAIVKSTKNRSIYFAERLYKSMKGLGTNDALLVYILVSRCEIDLNTIKQEFLRLYGKSLATMVHGDTSGGYRKALKALVGP